MMVLMMIVVSTVTAVHADESYNLRDDHVEFNQSFDGGHSDVAEGLVDCWDSCCSNTCLHHVTNDTRHNSVMKLNASHAFHIKQDVLSSQVVYGLKRPPRIS